MHGISTGAHTVFRTGTDFVIGADDTVVWQRGDGSPRPGATLPDAGSRFWVNYEHQGLVESAPRLTDRNPGSVTRLIAETFAREYAVIRGSSTRFIRPPLSILLVAATSISSRCCLV